MGTPKGRVRGTFSDASINYGEGMRLWGISDLIDKLDELQANVLEVAEQAIKESSAIVEKSMRDFMKGHTRPGEGPHTIDALGTEVKQKGTSVQSVTGFKMRDVPGQGDIPVGLPALFLDIGTIGGPHIKPTFFVYYAYKDNEDRIREVNYEIFKKAVDDAMKEKGAVHYDTV